MNKELVDLVINVLEAMIKLAESVDPNLESNFLLVELQKAISAIQALGL